MVNPQLGSGFGGFDELFKHTPSTNPARTTKTQKQ